MKIGLSTDPYQRLKGLQTANHEQLSLYWVQECASRDWEHHVHRALKPWRLAGEWFNGPVEMAILAVVGVVTLARPPGPSELATTGDDYWREYMNWPKERP